MLVPMPAWLEQEFLGNALWRWGLAVLIVLAAFVGLRLLAAAGRAIIRHTGGDRRDLSARLLRRTKSWLLLLVAVGVTGTVVALPTAGAQVLQRLAFVALLLQLGLWVNVLVAYSIHRALVSREEDEEEVSAAARTGEHLLQLLAAVGVWALLLLVALAHAGVDITALVAGLGVGGVAVALALQNVLGDLFASISILLDRPFEAGHFIIVGEHMGTVERVGLKTTRIKSLGGEELVFSNTDLLQSRVRNYTRMQERRIMFQFGVVYETPSAKLETLPELVRGIIETTPNTRFDRCHFKSYGDFALLFETVYYVLAPEYQAYMDAQHAINMAMFRVFEREGVTFAYPTQTVYLSKTATGAQESSAFTQT